MATALSNSGFASSNFAWIKISAKVAPNVENRCYLEFQQTSNVVKVSCHCGVFVSKDFQIDLQRLTRKHFSCLKLPLCNVDRIFILCAEYYYSLLELVRSALCCTTARHSVGAACQEPWL